MPLKPPEPLLLLQPPSRTLNHVWTLLLVNAVAVGAVVAAGDAVVPTTSSAEVEGDPLDILITHHLGTTFHPGHHNNSTNSNLPHTRIGLLHNGLATDDNGVSLLEEKRKGMNRRSCDYG
ncbi:hypothetical protein E3N88_26372 [Mikania micrantha]|uniref:Dirigent protein n=1 Tax=Mikania micrantha TaxID=192012 RepID=A0A5N6N950_9ASTR|nr:hypothetical protein E3N88_26372 [Mikania micrantha]